MVFTIAIQNEAGMAVGLEVSEETINELRLKCTETRDNYLAGAKFNLAVEFSHLIALLYTATHSCDQNELNKTLTT
jgi:hypothetical protein